MASVTRSTRRAEGLHPHHNNVSGPFTRSGSESLFNAASARGPGGVGGGRTNKRSIPLEATTERDYRSAKHKKARISVEIISKHPPSPESPEPASKLRSPPSPTVTIAKPVSTVAAEEGHDAPGSQQPGQPADQNNLTKYQAKVVNGIKHELQRLQPAGSAAESPSRSQGRKLRSRDVTRFKSELSAYFPEYDEVIGNEPKEEYLFNVDTPIVIHDTATTSTHGSGSALGIQAQPSHSGSTAAFPVRGYGDALYTNVSDCQTIDFSFMEAQNQNKAFDDPLPDAVYEVVHKRAARLERSIRNTEKGRAQHEKDLIVRLLESLQGHDWLRVMGVNGVTESKKKTFEPARNYFIKGCQAILDKFKNWTLEEKRRKQEKERALAEQAEEEESDDEEEAEEEAEEEEEEEEEDAEEDEDEEMEDDDDGMDTSEEDDSQGDSNGSATPDKQLRQEAMARSSLTKGSKRAKSSQAASRPSRPSTRPVYRAPSPPRPFTSFFSKRYERDNAVHRRGRPERRKIMAWGHTLPDMLEEDFMLPEEFRDEEFLRARARKKRRLKRGARS